MEVPGAPMKASRQGGADCRACAGRHVAHTCGKGKPKGSKTTPLKQEFAVGESPSPASRCLLGKRVEYAFNLTDGTVGWFAGDVMSSTRWRYWFKVTFDDGTTQTILMEPVQQDKCWRMEAASQAHRPGGGKATGSTPDNAAVSLADAAPSAEEDERKGRRKRKPKRQVLEPSKRVREAVKPADPFSAGGGTQQFRSSCGPTNNRPVITQVASRDFACSTCGKRFANRMSLGGHRRHGCASGQKKQEAAAAGGGGGGRGGWEHPKLAPSRPAASARTKKPVWPEKEGRRKKAKSTQQADTLRRVGLCRGLVHEWSPAEDEELAEAVGQIIIRDKGSWPEVAKFLNNGHSDSACRHRWQRCQKEQPHLRSNAGVAARSTEPAFVPSRSMPDNDARAWGDEEDLALADAVGRMDPTGRGSWSDVAEFLGEYRDTCQPNWL